MKRESFRAVGPVILILLLACCPNAFSQLTEPVLRFQTLTIDDGLSQNMVHSLLVDEKGFLWIGTSDGLNRFDGTDFRQYRHDPDDRHSLPGNTVLSLLQDSRSWIWIGTSHGVAVFDPAEGIIRPVKMDTVSESVRNAVQSLAEDDYGQIWFTGSRGLFKVSVPMENTPSRDFTVLRVFDFPDPEIELANRSMIARVSDSGYIYVGCNTGLFVAKTLEGWSDREIFAKIGSFPISHLAVDANQRVWAGLSNLHVYKPIEGHFLEPLKIDSSAGRRLRAIETDLKGNVWVSMFDFRDYDSSGSKLYRFDRESLEVERINGAVDPVISLAFTDSDLLWAGTAGYGVKKGDLKSMNFAVHEIGSMLHEIRNPKSGPYIFITKGTPRFIKLPEHEGEAGIFLDAMTGRSLTPDVNPPFSVQTHIPSYRSKYSFRYSVCDEKGHYWVFTSQWSHNTISIREYDTGMNLLKQKKFPFTIGQLPYVDAQDRLWFFADDRLAHLDRESWDVELFEVFDGTDAASLNCLLSDRKGIMWIGTDAGLVSFDPDRNLTVHYGKKNTILSYNVLSILNDPWQPDDYIWIGTDGGGLVKLSKSNGSIVHFTHKDGLPNLVIYAILPDALGRLWMSTNNGLVSMNLKTTEFHHFSREDGLPTNEFNRFLYGTLEDGRLWFESLSGIVEFDPLEVSLDTVAPKMAFTSAKSFNKSLSPTEAPDAIDKPITYAQSITLPWHDNVVTFNYTTLDFRAPGKNKFSTRMVGVDKDWSPPMSERTTTYANLAPGDYVFEVRASNSNGVWNNEGIAIALTILAPWWQSGWAYALYIVLLGVVIYGLYKLRINSIRLKFNLDNQRLEADRLHEVDRLKNEFFSNITHEFRTPITLIINPIQRLLSLAENPDEKTELKRIHRNANQLLRLINQLLDLGKIDSGMMRIDFVRGEVVQFVREIVDSFAPLATGKNIELNLVSAVPYREILFDPGALEKIAYNIISNAIKYTPKNGKVEVYLGFDDSATSSGLMLEVTDNGPGIALFDQKRVFERYFRTGQNNQAGGGKGIGLALVREITQLYGGEISLETRVGTGSKFTVILPIPEITEQPARFDGHVEHTPVDDYEDDDHETGGSETDEEKPLVLVVEDNEDLRGFLHNCLDSQYTVIEAENGAEGYEIALERIPDAVLCDVMMPVMDGMEFLEKVKGNQNTSHIPVIMLTAKTNRTDRENALGKGADAYLTKPFYETELLALLKNLLSIRAKTWNLHRTSVMKIRESKRHTAEEAFIDKLRSYIETNLSNPDIGVNDLCLVAAMSRTQLHRKLKALTGYSAGSLIRKVRLEKAREMLEVRNTNISEIAFHTGFNSHSYFSKCFSDLFGMSPSDYQKKFEESDAH